LYVPLPVIPTSIFILLAKSHHQIPSIHSFNFFISNPLPAFPETLLTTLIFIHSLIQSFSVPQIQQMYTQLVIIPAAPSFPIRVSEIAKSDCWLLLACPPARLPMLKLCSHWMDIHENLHLNTFGNISRKFKFH